MKKTGKKRVALYANLGGGVTSAKDLAAIQMVREASGAPEILMVGEYIDQDPSDTVRRPELQRLLRDARRGSFDEVWVPVPSHLAASTSRINRISRWLVWAGVDVCLHVENVDPDTAVGAYFLRLVDEAHELYGKLGSLRRRLPRKGRPAGTVGGVAEGDE